MQRYIPTIGIGAGKATTGQVLWQDMAGIRGGKVAKLSSNTQIFDQDYSRLQRPSDKKFVPANFPKANTPCNNCPAPLSLTNSKHDESNCRPSSTYPLLATT
ncbi:3-methyl-2-oxobutanoate hydroxymethyltransferase [Paenarthrobacter sp. RAF54_2]|uniref:3-methyl-2-oxobutanoate hydroxymethyltransferase n=1 Tax=Paenarthrobacter sp. RAF54_2 TaxID=3233061 RepID=UPI003F9DCA93